MRNLIRSLMRFLINIVAKVEVSGREDIPERGGFVIATNHLGFMDAPMAFYALNRWDLFIPVAEKWGESAFLRWLGKYLNFVFIDRFNPDIQAMRRIITLMEQEHILVIAPEGTRSRVGSLIEAKPGASYLAATLVRAIIPVGLAGTEAKGILGKMRRLRRASVLCR